MKKIILITQLFIGLTLFGQGNLQFNRAVHTEINCSSAAGINNGIVGATVSVVVPAGKTLKITSAYISNYYSGGSSVAVNYYDSKLILDNSPLAYCQYLPGNLEMNLPTNNFPLWLPAGTYTLKILYSTTYNYPVNTYFSEAYISGIEFNIVP